MLDFDVIAPNYRRAMELWPEAQNLAQCYAAMVACHSESGHGLVEHIKSFIESACITILGEFGQSVDSNSPSTTVLLRAALKPLGFENSQGKNKIDKVLSGFNKLSDALGEMRNDNGPVAHGKDGFLDPLMVDHARAYLHTGDAILGLLLNAMEGKEPNLKSTREPYNRFPHLHKRIDQSAKIEITVDEDSDGPIAIFTVTTRGEEEAIKIRAVTSQLLYGLDRDAYIDILNTVPTKPPSIEEEAPQVAASKRYDVTDAPRKVGGVPQVEIDARYEDYPATLRPRLEEFLRSKGWSGAGAEEGDADLVESLLATVGQNLVVDWEKRETLQARLKVEIRRVLVRFGFERERAGGISESLVAWIKVQASGIDETREREDDA